MRRQTTNEEGTIEKQVIDYQVQRWHFHLLLCSYILVQNQQRQLFPILSMVYAFHFTGKTMLAMYKQLMNEIGSSSVTLIEVRHDAPLMQRRESLE